jgi:hypothetical protein
VSACSTTIDGSASPAGAVEDAVPGPDGAMLAEAAAAALEEAGSARMVGTVSLDGAEIAVDLQMYGDDMAGSMRFEDLAIQMIRIGDDAYMQGPPAMWINQGLSSATAATLGDTWVRVPATAVFGLADTGLAGIAREIRSPGGTAVDGEVSAGELDGVPVWLISSPDGTVTRVAAEGTPYPLYSETADISAARLSEFGTVAPIVPPTDFVDLDFGGVGD